MSKITIKWWPKTWSHCSASSSGIEKTLSHSLDTLTVNKTHTLDNWGPGQGLDLTWHNWLWRLEEEFRPL